jgi:hypothetical protein
VSHFRNAGIPIADTDSGFSPGHDGHHAYIHWDMGSIAMAAALHIQMAIGCVLAILDALLPRWS